MSCSCRLKLVDDEPGIHYYRWACRNCGREYGPEFAVPHWSTIALARSLGRCLNTDPVPQVNTEICTRAAAAAWFPATAVGLFSAA
jgi:hypothetical protein